ncbi:HNH endonuclease [Patescibacteria group bacterium]|nr:HNH endonuclease [Patescibacteria group bacterium]
MPKGYMTLNGTPLTRFCLNCKKSFPWKRDTKGLYCSPICWQKSKEHKEVYRITFKGKKLSPEHIEKMAASKRGVKQSPELIERRMIGVRGRIQPQDEIERRRKALIGKKRSGIAHLNIIDGIAKSFGYESKEDMENYPSFNYRLKEEAEQKRLALIRDECKCMKCGSKEHLIVNHIIDRRIMYKLMPEEANALWNLITLCESCHKKMKGPNYRLFQARLMNILKREYEYNYLPYISVIDQILPFIPFLVE